MDRIEVMREDPRQPELRVVFGLLICVHVSEPKVVRDLEQVGLIPFAENRFQTRAHRLEDIGEVTDGGTAIGHAGTGPTESLNGIRDEVGDAFRRALWQRPRTELTKGLTAEVDHLSVALEVKAIL